MPEAPEGGHRSHAGAVVEPAPEALPEEEAPPPPPPPPPPAVAGVPPVVGNGTAGDETALLGRLGSVTGLPSLGPGAGLVCVAVPTLCAKAGPASATANTAASIERDRVTSFPVNGRPAAKVRFC
jgi:hypothetical protein